MRAMAFSFTRFLDHAQRRTTVGRTPLDEWSAPSQRPLSDNTQHSQQTSTWPHTTLKTDLYLTTYNTHNRPLPDNTQHSQQTDIHANGGTRNPNPSKRGLQTHSSDHAATALGYSFLLWNAFFVLKRQLKRQASVATSKYCVCVGQGKLIAIFRDAHLKFKCYLVSEWMGRQ